MFERDLSVYMMMMMMGCWILMSHITFNTVKFYFDFIFLWKTTNSLRRFLCAIEFLWRHPSLYWVFHFSISHVIDTSSNDVFYLHISPMLMPNTPTQTASKKSPSSLQQTHSTTASLLIMEQSPCTANSSCNSTAPNQQGNMRKFTTHCAKDGRLFYLK